MRGPLAFSNVVSAAVTHYSHVQDIFGLYPAIIIGYGNTPQCIISGMESQIKPVEKKSENLLSKPFHCWLNVNMRINTGHFERFHDLEISCNRFIDWVFNNLLWILLLRNKLLKKSSETQVWLTISLLLPTHCSFIWYHWKALLFLFTMMCHLLWLRNLGMCSTPEYGGGCKVKCAKMHCYCYTL